MKIPQDGYLLRIFIGEGDHWHGKPLYEAIVLKARENCTWPAPRSSAARWASVRKAICTPPRSCRLSEDLPMIIEIVDAKEKIDALMPHIDAMVQDGLVTLERVQVIKYHAGSPPANPS